MNRTIVCFGYVARGVAIALTGGFVFVSALCALVWFSDASTKWLGVQEKFGVLFFFGYLVAIIGGIIGASFCPTPSISRPNGETP